MLNQTHSPWSIKQTHAAGTLLALMANGLAWLIAWRMFPRADSAAILHYTSNVGIDFIGQGNSIISLPVIGLFIIVFNSLLSATTYRADSRTTWLFSAGSLLVQFLLILTLLFLWRINQTQL